MSPTNKMISIVIPCYNEEGNIELLNQQLLEELKGYDVEIIFVDDNSYDQTLPILKKMATDDKRIKFVSFSRNFGHQSALRAGIAYATGECCITMDADLQHPPQLLKQMIHLWEDGYDIVFTRRMDNKKTSAFKRLTSNLFYKTLNTLGDVHIEQGAADFRLTDKKVLKVLNEAFPEYHMFYRGIFSWIGFNQTSIDYVPNQRHSGSTKYSLGKMLAFASDGITSFSIKPLKIASILGFIVFLLSCLYGVYALILVAFTDKAIAGWTSLLLSILFIGGLNMIFIGILGEYIGKIFIQSKNRPPFIIKETNVIK